jgi:hypothetical protein
MPQLSCVVLSSVLFFVPQCRLSNVLDQGHCGSGFADSSLCLKDPDPDADPDPAIFVIDLQDANKN